MLCSTRSALLTLLLFVPVGCLGCAKGRVEMVSAEKAAPEAVKGNTSSPVTAAQPGEASQPGQQGQPGQPGQSGPGQPAKPNPPVELIKPTGQPVDAPAEGIILAYKFSKGQKANFEVSLKQEMAMEIKMPAGQQAPAMLPPGGFRIDQGGTLQFVQEVKSLGSKSEATIETRIVDGEYRQTNPVVGEMVVTVHDGKTEVLLNGQKQTDNKAAGPLLAMFQSGKDITVGTTGKLNSPPVAAQKSEGLGSMMGGGGAGLGNQTVGGYGLLVLPTKPVKPGDKWSDVQVIPMPEGSGKTGKVTLTTTYIFKEILQQGVHRVAVIDSVAIASFPAGGITSGPMKIDQMKTKTSGTSQFDIDAGELLTASYKIEMDMGMAMTMRTPNAAAGSTGAPPPAGGAMKMTMSGGGNMNVVRKPGH